MADTFTQIDIQLVYAVKNRQCLIDKSWKEELYRYITGIVQNHNHKMLRINGMPDHIHLFLGYNPNQLIPTLLNEIKTSSNQFINNKRFTKHKFSWQNGYGAFSYSRSQRNSVIKYIENQEEHHKKKTFREEYIDFLQQFKIEYKDEYLFDFIDKHSLKI